MSPMKKCCSPNLTICLERWVSRFQSKFVIVGSRGLVLLGRVLLWSIYLGGLVLLGRLFVRVLLQSERLPLVVVRWNVLLVVRLVVRGGVRPEGGLIVQG